MFDDRHYVAKKLNKLKYDKVKEIHTRQIIIKLLEAKGEERILKESRKQWSIMYKEPSIRLTADFSSET